MITPLRSLLDRILTRAYPSLDDRCARMAHHLAQPAMCADDARVGARRTQEGGAAHPQHPVSWATTAGVSLKLLHSAHAAHQITTARAVDDSSARLVRRRVRRSQRATVTRMRRSA